MNVYWSDPFGTELPEGDGSPPVRASFRSECEGCFSMIEVGDVILPYYETSLGRLEWAHEECVISDGGRK